MNTEEFDDIPDEVLSEVDEDDTELNLADDDDVSEQANGMVRGMLLLGTSVILAEMVEEDVITLREYFALTDYLEEQEATLSF